MADFPGDGLHRVDTVESHAHVTEIKHYTGGDACEYECGEPAEFVVNMEDVVAFVACHGCLKRARIYPVDNEWLDALSPRDKVMWA